MQQYTLHEVDDLLQVVRDVIALLSNTKGSAAVLALHGELGAGKTTFMQTLARELGVSETITSPTFVVMKKYATPDEQFSQLVHIDAYRIEDIDEMRPLKFAEELEQNGSIIGIEWAEKIADLLPPHTLHLRFAIAGKERIITLNGQKDE